MIIPSIDLMGGRVVQLVQGEALALERDLDCMLAAFAGFPALQVIDLDAARGAGDNCALVKRCCQAGFRVRVGGGIRGLDRAREVLAWGAEKVIIGSAAFVAGAPDLAFLERLQAVGRQRLMLALDARNGQVVIRGWRAVVPLTPLAAATALEPYAAEFLYTHVDTEGTMAGLPLAPVAALRAATTNALTVAGGIASLAEIEALDALRCHVALGMAVYTGRLSLQQLREFKATT